jgi:ABC-type lipoprotein export system ATPase subunit
LNHGDDDNMSDEQPILRVESVEKSYGRRSVLQGVSFSVSAGERVGIMGPSGSGKSTLLNCLVGIDAPQRGSIAVAGQPVTGRSAEGLAALRRHEVSTVFQFFHLLPTLTAYENIELPLQLIGLKAVERAARVAELIDAVAIGHRQHALPGELSGGEMQRVAIARALVHRPRLLLADEPTGNLDRKTGDTVLDLLQSLAETYHMAMLLVTHSSEATRICHRVLHMVDGQLLDANGS